MTDDEYQFLTRRIEKLLDIDLSAYKPAQMRRRVGAFIDPQRRGQRAEVLPPT